MTTVIRLIIIPFLFLFSSFAHADEHRYTCPMHPHYISNDMGTCPICGMDLVPVEDGSADGQAMSDSGEMDGAMQMRQTITIAPETIQNMGVRTEDATMAKFGKDIRSYGQVTENVRLTHVVSSRIEGWVETLKVTAVGDAVKKGDLLFTLYSPDFIAAQQDYRAALATGIQGRITSSAKRLESLGVSQRVIAQIRSNKVNDLPIYAQTDGIVSALMVNLGSYIKPGMQVATIQDYSSVWIEVNVAEQDLQFLRTDTPAVVTFPNLGGIERTAKIDYIYPTIEQDSRTGRIRLVLDNEDGTLKPGAYADVVFQTDVEQRLSVPSEAILKSSEGDFVVVSLGEGRFQPKAVETGIQNKGRTEITDGIADGETIVVSGQFMIDSESALRESFRKLETAQTPLSLIQITPAQQSMIDHLIDAALYLHEAQTSDFEPEPRFLKPALDLNDYLLPEFRGTKLEFVLKDAEQAVQQAQKALTEQEQQQALAELVLALKPWITEGKPKYYKDKGVKLYLDHGTGNYWLQLEDDILHPYGDGHAVEVELPDSVMADAPSVTMPAGDAHAHH